MVMINPLKKIQKIIFINNKTKNNESDNIIAANYKMNLSYLIFEKEILIFVLS